MSADPVSELASFRAGGAGSPDARRHSGLRHPGHALVAPRGERSKRGERGAEPDVARLEKLLNAVAAAAEPRRP